MIWYLLTQSIVIGFTCNLKRLNLKWNTFNPITQVNCHFEHEKYHLQPIETSISSHRDPLCYGKANS